MHDVKVKHSNVVWVGSRSQKGYCTYTHIERHLYTDRSIHSVCIKGSAHYCSQELSLFLRRPILKLLKLLLNCKNQHFCQEWLQNLSLLVRGRTPVIWYVYLRLRNEQTFKHL